MPRLRHASSEQRRACFEQFEQRLVMSAQAVATLLPELQIAAPAITQQIVSQPLNNTTPVSPTTAAANIAAQYGFDGNGQTVAVIDSGIAWDHNALGGGFGQGHKVVGGWDFAENDALPYDSGAAAMHGTHVAGIVASEHDRYRGVSSGADLVSLRVFNDQGEGQLEWVRQALQWVHQHRSSFENPITTVVMSLGTTWNAHNTPSWAMLENELAALKQAGIFISVAAGNSFQDYNAPGLSYPAVSSHVVPVASHDSSGQMSDFSQRSSRVLVAPGEEIRSTVPNHLFTGMTDRFMALTGTSMAAPYVAGASAILRQANEFMGRQGIDQAVLYQQMLNSADQIFDSATNSQYSRLNLAAALSHVIPDLEGNTAETAKNIGQLGGGERISGTIGKLNDADFFSFTARASGQLRLTINTTHDLDAMVNVLGSQATLNGNVVTFAVEAGREYKFSVGTSDGIGHFTIDTHLQSGPPAIQWGQISSNSFTNQVIRGESLFRMQASQNGILAVQTSASQSGNLQLEIYDGQMNRIGTCNGNCTDLRLSVSVTQGETYFLKATGNVEGVNFAVGNTVSLSSGMLTINGTAGNDNFEVNAQNGFAVKVNGIAYQFQQSDVQSVRIAGGAGTDALTLMLGNQNDDVVTRTNGLSVRNSSFGLDANNVEQSVLNGGAGTNTVLMNDSAGADLFVAGAQSSTLSGAGFSTTVSNFNWVSAVSSGGADRAEFNGTADREYFWVKGSRSSMNRAGSLVVADNFATTSIRGGGGDDHATVIEAAGDQSINVRHRFVARHGANGSITIAGVSQAHITAQPGTATLRFFDSQANDEFVIDNGTASMNSSDLYQANADGFRRIIVQSRSGRDSVQLFDTTGNDTFVSSGSRTELTSANLTVVTTGASRVTMTSRWGGWDTATISGTQGDDSLVVNQQSTTLHDSLGRTRSVTGFQRVNVDLGSGNNTANYQGSIQAETLKVNRAQTEFQTARQTVTVSNAKVSNFQGSGGNDRVILNELNLLTGMGDRAIAYLDQHRVTVEDFSNLEAQSVDNAMAEYDLDIVDFQYLLRGNWRAR